MNARSWARRAAPLLAAVLLCGPLRAEEPAASPRIRPKRRAAAAAPRAPREPGAQPDTDAFDAPTTGVLDNYGYSSRSRFHAKGGILQYLAFGVYPGISLGASAAVDGLIGDEKHVRMRAPTAQVKYRFFDGDSELPSLAVGFDGQGYRYNATDRRFNQRQRGFFLVATKEIGVPGFQVHPSFNISDFDSNGVFGAIPLTFNIRDRAAVLVEWDHINNWSDSRLNMGLRAYLTQTFQVDFAVRAIGASGFYGDGAPKGPERVVQIKYSNSF